jgi:5,10-methylenetetrahydromethanopterin reductase
VGELPSFGIQLHAVWPMSAYRELAELVETFPCFDELTVHDVIWNRPVWPILTLIASATRRVKVGPDVTHPFVRHPAITANNIAAIDELTQGRAVLGIGKGSFFESIGIFSDKATDAVREMVLLTRRFLAGDRVPFRGQVFSADERAVLRWQPFRKEIPIFIGAFGPKMLAVAGEVADEVRPPGIGNPAVLQAVQQAVRRGEQLAGRRPGSVKMGAEVWTCLSEDSSLAWRMASRLVAQFTPYLGNLPELAGLDPDEVKSVRALASQGRLEEAASAISEATVNAFCIWGPADRAVAWLERVLPMGLTSITFSGTLGPDVRESIRTLGARVIPYFTG